MPARSVSVKWERTISTKGSTRATAYEASNKIIAHDDMLIVTWLDAPGRAMIQAFQADDSEPIGDALMLNEGIDNHCGAAVTVDRDGYLHAMCGSHNEVPFMHRVSRQPWDVGHWWPGRPVSDNPAYPSLICDTENRLHLTYRWWTGIGARSVMSNYFVSPSAGYQRTAPGFIWEGFGNRREPLSYWSDPAMMVMTLVPNQYGQFGGSLAIGGDGRLHLGFHIYDQKHSGRGHTVGYLRSGDGGDSWRTASGDEVILPCGPTTADTLESDFAGVQEPAGVLDMRASNVAVTPDGNPLICAHHYEDGNARLWEHDGSSWSHTDLRPVLHGVYPDSHNLAGGPISVDGAGNTYAALQMASDGEGWGSDSAEVVLLFRPAGGEEWQVLPLSEPGSGVPNWLPSMERITSPFQTIGVPHLMYQHGTKGVGCETYDENEVRLVALEVD